MSRLILCRTLPAGYAPTLRGACAALLFAALVSAQSKPAIPCPDLRALTNNEVSVAIAQPIAASENGPAHCRVAGQILPQVAFEIRMPAEWNGRFVMVGNGGDAGEATDRPRRGHGYGRETKRR